MVRTIINFMKGDEQINKMKAFTELRNNVLI
jgi:hypothetical protein